MRDTIRQIQMYYYWRKILHLRKKGNRRLKQGVPMQDAKLQLWSSRLTNLGMAVHRLEARARGRIDKHRGGFYNEAII